MAMVPIAELTWKESRVSRISLSKVTNPARDWYTRNNPTFEIPAFLASSESTGLGESR